MEQDNNNMHEAADRTGSNRFKDESDENDTRSMREANQKIRQNQGDDATELPSGRSGNRPRFDRDR